MTAIASIAAVVPREVETAVIGSGPGGAITAAVLAESGREVLLIEEGGRLSQGEFAPFGIDEMRAAYRKRGMTAALGAPPINYVEGRCLGGGSEINSGLYHRPPTAALRRWKELGADDSRIVEMCEMNERDLGVTPAPGETQPASELLAQGARALGWSCAQTPRWHRYDSGYRPLAPGGARQSMSETFLPRFAAAGGRVVDGCEARRLRRESGGWRIDALIGGRETSIFARAVFVACGATRTPALLRRSGIKKGIGESLRMHVFTRVVAEFDRPINARGAGVGPHQIDCFAPRLRLGCAVSSPEHVALALAQSDPRWLRDHDEKWPCRAAYYATVGGGRGVVRALAGGGEVVFYRLRRRRLLRFGGRRARAGAGFVRGRGAAGFADYGLRADDRIARRIVEVAAPAASRARAPDFGAFDGVLPDRRRGRFFWPRQRRARAAYRRCVAVLRFAKCQSARRGDGFGAPQRAGFL